MARADDRNQLSELIDLLRAKGVVKYVRDDMEILMGPQPATRATKPEEKDPRAGKRAHYMNLLGRASIADTELDLLPDGV